jgi:hypothetical protein
LKFGLWKNPARLWWNELHKGGGSR